MSSPHQPSTRPNYLLSQKSPDAAPVFQGESRVLALKHLSQAVAERRAMAVMQLVAKDPSLALESVDVPSPGAQATSAVPFALACLHAGIASGYVFAVSRGFDINQPLLNGATTLLQSALAAAGTGRSIEADVSLLLGMGADPALMRSSEPLYTAFAAAYPPKAPQHRPGAVMMLLDAKAKFEFDAGILCPYSMLVMTGGWGTDEGAAELLKTMAKLAKSGHDPSLRTGSPRQAPLERAIGLKNPRALIALIRVGAKVDREALNGEDLLDLVERHGMKDAAPLVKEALMEAHISASTRAHEMAAGSSAATSNASNPRRRRAGAV